MRHIIIDSRQILANYLQTRDQITIRELNDFAGKIRQAVPSIHVDVSRRSLSATLEDYPTMFKRHDEVTIVRTPASEEYFKANYVNVFFNEELPAEIRSPFIACFGDVDV